MPLTKFDSRELESFTRAFEDLFNDGDPASMTSYYTQDAQLMAEGREPIRGQAAIDEFWRVAISRAAAAPGNAHHPAPRVVILGRPGIRPVHCDSRDLLRAGRARREHLGVGRDHLAP